MNISYYISYNMEDEQSNSFTLVFNQTWLNSGPVKVKIILLFING